MRKRNRRAPVRADASDSRRDCRDGPWPYEPAFYEARRPLARRIPRQERRPGAVSIKGHLASWFRNLHLISVRPPSTGPRASRGGCFAAGTADGVDRPDDGPNTGRARPKHRRHRAASNHWRPRRIPAFVLGGDRIHRHEHRLGAAVRSVKRPLRAQVCLFGLDFRIPGRLYRLRTGRRPSSADLVPRRAGTGRRRLDRAGADGGRRPRVAARARALPGPVRCCFCRHARSQGR